MTAAPLHDDTLVPNALVNPDTIDAAPFILDTHAFEAFYQQVALEVRSVGTDVSTKKDRDAIKSAAFKVAKCKTRCDEARKNLTADARRKIDEFNDAGKTIKDRLQNLQDEVRRPLSEWEEAETRREKAVNEAVQLLNGILAQPARLDEASDRILERLNELKVMEIKQAVFLEDADRVEQLRDLALSAVETALATAKQREAEAEELARLRAEANARKIEEEKAQRDKEAAELEAQRAKEREEAAERAAEAAAQKARQEEREAIAREQEAREAQEKAEQEAREKKAANKRHQAAVTRKAINTLMQATEIDEGLAARIIEAIADDQVANVTINF